MPTAPHYYAVVTGDIVRSTRLSREKFRDVQDSITRAGGDLATHLPGRLPFPIELSRGDSWQLFVPDPGDALRMALFVRAFIRAEAERVDTRFSIGVGTVDKLPDRTVGDGRGDAFRLSGERIENKRAPRMQFAMEHDATQMRADGWWEDRSISTMLAVMDAVVTRWTSAQATAVRGALLNWKQEQIAETWPHGPITQQSASQHLDRAGWAGVYEALDYYEDVMKKWGPR